MILDEFDSNPVAVFNAFDFKQKMEGFPKTIVGFFSHELVAEFVNSYKPEVITTIKSYTTNFPVYKVKIGEEDIAVIQAPLGSPYCVELFEEIICLGTEKIMMCGSCGCLESGIADYSIVIPTSAIRDEGTSYHYAPASDEIEVNEDAVKSIENTIKSLGLNYLKGKTWTTDALYRETPAKVAKRKSQGAIVVDMECSAMVAFAKFRGVTFGEVFYGADDLSKDEYDIRSLLDGDISVQSKIIPIVLKCAENLSKGV